jgi:hypothetical protein
MVLNGFCFFKWNKLKVATRKETLNEEIKHRKIMKERINLLIR